MDDDSNSNLLEKIRQYQNSIIKHSEKGNDERIMYYIKKLYDMSVTVEHLKQTGIGRTMNSLRKYSGNVGIASKAIVAQWKSMVSTEEEEAKVKSEPQEDYDSPPESPQPPPPSEKMKIKSDRREEYSECDESPNKSRRHDSSDRSSKSRSEDRHSSKSHHRNEEKRDSHKSSHKEREHKSHSHKSRHESVRHKKDDKSRHEHKRKYEEERTSPKKMKYEANSSDSDDSNRLLVQDNASISSLNSEDNTLPDSTTHYEDLRENTQSPSPPPVEKIDHKKHQKIDKHEKHRSRDKDRDKKEVNGSHSSKKSSHRDKEIKSSEIKKEKPSKSPKDSTKSASPSKSPEKSKKVLIDNDNGIDSGSGASFAEALGMMMPSKSGKAAIKKKSSSACASPTPSTSTTKSTKTTPKPRTQSPLTQSPNLNLLSPNLKLEPLDSIIVPQLPEITTNYKPLGLNFDATPSSIYDNLKHMTEDEALSVVITTKNLRTKVYSGNKTNYGFVPSLFNICVRVLQDNIDALEYTGGVPYEILKPVLERATANQLLNSEYYNPYLIEETDELWELHCKRECRAMKRQEMETWREMYLRCRDERDAKLKALTVNIKQSIDKSLPVRQTKLAYVDSVVKPPRGIARKQAKHGTGENLKRPLITPTQRLNAIASGSGEKISVPNPSPRSTSSHASSIKPKKAPLMQKTLALLKGGRFGRR